MSCGKRTRPLRGRVEELETRLSTLSIPPAEPAPWEEREDGEEVEVLRVRVRELERQLAAAETERAEAAGGRQEPGRSSAKRSGGGWKR